MKPYLLFFSLISVAMLATPSWAQNCHATLYGTVTDADTGEPVPYAEVFLIQTSQGQITDEKGKFAFTKLCEGLYTVTCDHIGCQHLSKEIKLVGEMSLNFSLAHEALNLGEVVVQEKAIVPTATQTERTLSSAALDAAKGQSIGDMLKVLPGVNSLNTGGSIAKPVIRGLHSNRVLMLNNGVRQEGQQWGSEHAPEIDPYIAGKVLVVYGANGVRYGSDAIGGVVLVEPKPLRQQKGVGGEVNLAGFSNGRSGAAAVMLDGKLGGKLPLAGRLQGTFRRGGNLRAPDYFLENTGMQETNYSATLGLQRERWESEVFFSQFFTKIGIFSGSHIGNMTDLENAIERGRPLDEGAFSYDLNRPLQRVAHYLLKVKNSLRTGTAGKLSLQYARQFNRREEFDAHKRFGTLPEHFDDPEMMFEITTHSLDLAWEHKSWRHFTGSIGGQVLAQRNTTDRGGLIPDFDSQTAGVFWIERWRKYPFPLEFEAGLRYDFRRLDVANRGNEVIDKQLDFNNLSGTFGAVYKMAKNFDVRLNLGTAWRSPNVNELFSDGVHHGSASYERGREGLLPERAYNASLAFGFDNHSNLSASLSLYQNRVQDFIYLEPQEQPVLTIRGAFPSFAYQQTDATLTGLDWGAEWSPVTWLAFSSTGSILRARNTKDDEWLVLMPADRFRHGVRFFLDKNKKSDKTPFIGAAMQNVLRQSRVPAGVDYAPSPAGYTLFDLEAGMGFELRSKSVVQRPQSKDHSAQPSVQVILSIQNMFDTAYRDYLNRLRYFSDEAGRNVALRLKFNF